MGDFIDRIEAHVARTNELIERDRAEWHRARAAQSRELEDIRFEQRQMTLRGERIAQGYLRALEDMSVRLEDMGDQIRANTQAVLAALDRFERGNGPAAAG